jgi:hypothetical protein
MISSSNVVAERLCKSPEEGTKGSSIENVFASVVCREESAVQSNASINGAWDSKSKSPVRAASDEGDVKERETGSREVSKGSVAEKDNVCPHPLIWWFVLDSESSR